jgi:hypothetical protein
LDWNFQKLTEKGASKEQIISKIPHGNYKIVDFDLPDNFLDSNFLGFSYLVPQIQGIEVQQKYFSSVFRNINIQGKTLLSQESRASLYFLKQDFDHFFNPEFARDISIRNSNADSKIDFVRYLSLLSQYAKEGGTTALARGYKLKMEAYYEQYIYSVVGESISSLFKPFYETFPNNDFESRFNRLSEAIATLEMPKQFPSIIDADIYLFGLIYVVVFEEKVLDVQEKIALKVDVDSKIADFKAIDSHKRAPGALMYLKDRINASINIFNHYCHE